MDLTNTIAPDDNTNPQSGSTKPGLAAESVFIESKEPVVEKISPHVETLSKSEVETAAEKQVFSLAQDDNSSNTPTSASTPSDKDKKSSVVNKTTKSTVLHSIEHPADKLTEIADKEEEEFINQVNTAHGTQ